jgi:hypothetical protein
VPIEASDHQLKASGRTSHEALSTAAVHGDGSDQGTNDSEEDDDEIDCIVPSAFLQFPFFRL